MRIKGAKSWEEGEKGEKRGRGRGREMEGGGGNMRDIFRERDGNKETWKMSVMTQNMNICDKGKKAKKSEAARKKGDKVER